MYISCVYSVATKNFTSCTYHAAYTFIMLLSGSMNSLLTISLQTNNDNTITVECSQGQDSSVGQSFECEFCYTSAESTSTCHIGSNIRSNCKYLEGSAMTLSALTEGQYCYRAAAIIDGTPSAVVQDSFSIHPLTGISCHTCTVLA